ncbi:MAG: VWA domain-containing protein [Actinomycetota bacterium]|nr:VWA domain-containing protein [Actinomycetota bacterium]
MSFRNFASPWWFLLLLVVIALAGGYVLTQRLSRKRSLRFANLELLGGIESARPNRFRHLPPVFLILGLLLLTTAMAGPTAQQKVPRNRATVVLVIDVSLSMKSTDVAPSRLKAAQVAAKSFVEGLTPGVNLGLITFAGTATVLVAPTTDRGGVANAIDNLKLAQSTATGEAIFAALQSVESFSQVVGGPEGPPPARIVLMSDGKQTIPTEVEDDPRGSFTAAKAAADREIPITTISFGTSDGTVEIEDQVQEVPVDDSAMKEIAELSNGDFYRAATAEQLRSVYDTLGEQIGYEIKEADASRPWLILGALAVMISAAGALVIGQRLP